MSEPPASGIVLDPDLRDFVQGGVSIVAASRDAGNAPSIARGRGCRVSADGRAVTILLAVSQAGRLLADIGASGAIAVVFSEPSSHRTVQLKGNDARVVAGARDYADLVVGYRAALAADLNRIGFGDAYVQALLYADAADLVAVTFTPAAAFTQTPGPNAGALLAMPR